MGLRWQAGQGRAQKFSTASCHLEAVFVFTILIKRRSGGEGGVSPGDAACVAGTIGRDPSSPTHPRKGPPHVAFA